MNTDDDPQPVRRLHEGCHLELVETDGWEFVRRRRTRDVVGVLAITGEGELLLVEQARIPTGSRVIELPAGLVADERPEGLLEAAARELEEETGWRPGRLERLWTGPSSAGLTDERVTLVRARDLVQIHAGGGVDGERILVHRVPLDRLDIWLAEQESRGCLVDLKVRLVWHALESSDRC